MKKNQIYLFIGILFLFVSACDEPEKEYVAPKIWTMPSFDITTTEATFRANFTKGSEDITIFGFEWKETMTDDWKTVHAQANNGSYTFTMNNLKEDVEYTVKAFIVDAFDKKYFGEERRFSTNGTVMDIDGNVYLTLRYGSKVWMTENLRVTRYADGTPIEGRSGGYNADSDGPVYFHGGHHTPYFKEPNFGLLYNWAAAARVDDCGTAITITSFVQGVCPDGWYFPSMGEWGELISRCGGFEEAGAAMKTNTWSESSYSTANPSRFSIEPSGWYYYEEGKSFRSVFGAAYFWTLTQTPLEMKWASYAIALVLENPECHIIPMRKCAGYSVRCVKDYSP